MSSYSSDIRIVTTIEGFETMKILIDNYLGSIDSEEKDLLYNLQEYIINQQDNYIILGWNNLPSDESSEDGINSIKYSLEELKERNIPFRFARIGDEIIEWNGDLESLESDAEGLPELCIKTDFFYVHKRRKIAI